jgi:hypothetical protein
VIIKNFYTILGIISLWKQIILSTGSDGQYATVTAGCRAKMQILTIFVEYLCKKKAPREGSF